MTTLDEVIDWSNSVLETIEGLHVTFDRIPDSPNFPCAMTYPVPVTDYRDGLSDGQVHVFEIIVLVAAAFTENQRSVIPYLERTGSSSIFAAFESRRGTTTGFDAHIRDTRPLDQQEVAGYRGTGAAVTLHVTLD